MFVSFVSQFLIVIVVSCAPIYFYFKYFVYNFWRERKVIHPEPTFLIGNIKTLLTGTFHVGDFFRHGYEKYKKHRVYGMYSFYKPSLVITDPELIKFVLTKEFGSFHDRGMYCNEKIDPMSGHLFLLPGQKWRNLRVKLTPTFTSGKIKQMFNTVKEIGDNFARTLGKTALENSDIEIKDMVARFSTDVIMSTAFGINSNSLENPQSEFRYWGERAFKPQAIVDTFVVFAPKLLEIFSIPSVERSVGNFFLKTFSDTVKYRNTHNVSRHDFLDLIMQLMNKGYVPTDTDKVTIDQQDTVERLSMSEGAAQAFVFILAGFETSSTTASYCLYELAMHQEIQEKVRQEIDTVFKKHGGLTYDSLHHMTYLNQVVSETLRKYPPLSILNRICTKEVTLPEIDLTLPKETLIVIPVLGLHRDPEIYPNPDKFDPERFTEDNIASRHQYVYLPFGEGPRICIGTRFALVQVKVALISALSNFRFKVHPDTPTTLELDQRAFLLTAKGGVHLMIEPR